MGKGSSDSHSFFTEQLKLWMKPDALQKIYLCSSSFCKSPDDFDGGIFKILSWNRMIIMLGGEQRFSISVGGTRRDIKLLPGDVLYWARYAWQIEHWDQPCTFMGIIFRENTLRFILVNHVKAGPSSPPSCIYHTALPISGAAPFLINALNFLAESGNDADTSRHIISALLNLSFGHLEADLLSSGHKDEGIASRRWHQIYDYLQEHFSAPINRKTVAEAFSVHPNYLSCLASIYTGKNFQDLLENLRMEEARRLLRQTSLSVERVAESCGYHSASYFVTAFKRLNGFSPSKYRLSMPSQRNH